MPPKNYTILIRVEPDELEPLRTTKHKIEVQERRDVTWLELLKLGTATALAYGLTREKKKR